LTFRWPAAHSVMAFTGINMGNGRPDRPLLTFRWPAAHSVMAFTAINMGNGRQRIN